MENLSFGAAFKYPFNRFKGMFNILWVLLPIFGWFALGGYGVRLVNEWVEGKFEQLPEFSFGSDMKLGFILFLKAIPLMILYAVAVGILVTLHENIGKILNIVFAILVLPMVGIHFMVKQTVKSSFEFTVSKAVFNNLIDYIVMLLKSIGLAIVFFFLYFVLVGIPGNAFTKNIFLADFYRRHKPK